MSYHSFQSVSNLQIPAVQKLHFDAQLFTYKAREVARTYIVGTAISLKIQTNNASCSIYISEVGMIG